MFENSKHSLSFLSQKLYERTKKAVKIIVVEVCFFSFQPSDEIVELGVTVVK